MKRIIGLHVVLTLVWALAPATVAHAQGSKAAVCEAALNELWAYYNHESTAADVQAAINSCAVKIQQELDQPPPTPPPPPSDFSPCTSTEVLKTLADGTRECVTPEIVWDEPPHKCTRVQRGVIAETGPDGTVTGRVVYRDNPNWIKYFRLVPSGSAPWDCQPDWRCAVYDRMAGLTPPASDAQRANGVRVTWGVQGNQQTYATLYHPCYSGSPAQPVTGSPNVQPGTITGSQCHAGICVRS